jgi:perosamine synthetase
LRDIFIQFAEDRDHRQGGAVVTNDEEIFRKMLLLRDFGRSEGGSDHYLSIGWNLKFTDLQATIGLSQMGRIGEIVALKKRVFAWYRQCLEGVRGVEVPATDLASVTPWFVDILVDKSARAPLMAHLKAHGVGSRPIYPPLHGEPAFAVDGAFPVAESVSVQGLWLPSSLRLNREQVERICGLITGFAR